ncbi:MAG: hypothetical protein HXY43_09310, partial [Fischerella sp.]|uniref:hypothetical protein n=1 Tax=Fischerella sp. TaxID=1191 RepID=UPI001817FB75
VRPAPVLAVPVTMGDWRTRRVFPEFFFHHQDTKTPRKIHTIFNTDRQAFDVISIRFSGGECQQLQSQVLVSQNTKP